MVKITNSQENSFLKFKKTKKLIFFAKAAFDAFWNVGLPQSADLIKISSKMRKRGFISTKGKINS